MVSTDEPLGTSPGKKRKHKMEDNVNSVEAGDMPKEIQVENGVEKIALSGESLDLISQLPDYVIHHILSFLQNLKDAVRTSSFSKRWKALRFSYSVLIFDEQKFARGIGPENVDNKEIMFREYIFNSLGKCLENNLQIQKLLLRMTFMDLLDASIVDNGLIVAFSRNIKELDLHIGFNDNKRSTVPEVVFSSETLTGLRLSGCILKNYRNIVLPHLQKLYLRKVHLTEYIVIRLISGCPLIEDLRFIQCSGLKFFYIFHPSLSRLEIHNCNQLKKVNIMAPNLDTFWFSGKKLTACKVILDECNL